MPAINWTPILEWGQCEGRTKEFSGMKAEDLQAVVDLCCYAGDSNMAMSVRIQDLLPGIDRTEAGAIVLHFRVKTKTSENP